MKKLLIPLCALLLLLGACDDNSGDSGFQNIDFDRKAILTNWADNIIVPSYEAFSTSIGDFETAVSTFTTTPTTTNLDALQAQWLATYKKWQHISLFEIGKAEEILYRGNMNTFPTSTADIDNVIASGTYDLDAPASRAIQGFPAFDYLLFGLADSDAKILEFYTTNANATNYKTYLTDLVTRMKTLHTSVIDAWKNGYRDEFVNNDGSSANASLDRMVNDLNFYYERFFRDGKIGIPAGIRSSGTAFANKVEAFYQKEASKELFLESLTTVENFFNGKSYTADTEGTSIKSYLNAIHEANGGENLADAINAQFASIKTAADKLDDSFADQITNDNSLMLRTFDELQKNIILMKNNMLQSLSISADYFDADGD